MGALIDIHVHLPDPATFPLFAAKGEKRLLLRLLLRRMKKECREITKEKVEEYNLGIFEAIEESMLDRAVLLALDYPHGEDGSMINGGRSMACSNEYIAALCGKGGKLLFGASIHPYRRDARKRLQWCIDHGACLVKWVPSAQNIDPSHERCLPFYEILAANGVPLLCHTGIEHTLPGRNNALNDPVRLLPALKRGVTVIAAHCGARMLLHERSCYDSWRRMALEHENLYGDISAFLIPTRMHLLFGIKNDERLLAKVLYGSDFPGFPDILSCLAGFGVRSALALRREANPFNRHLRALREVGLPDAVFSRAAGLLRMGAPSEVAA